VGKTILVVEDDGAMREWISLHLKNAGYTVRSVANGLAAAGACLQAKPDLIISDLHMPGMGGFDMIKILNSEAGLSNIPVIFLTVDANRKERSSQLGAVEYLTKPIEPEALVAAVAKHLSS
jgi:CheY-like chemotaxis protein